MRSDWASFTRSTATLKAGGKEEISAARRGRPRILRGWRVLGVGGSKRERERGKKRVYEWMECIDGWPAKRLEVWGYKEGWMKSVNGDREEGEGVAECKKCKKALNIWGDERAMNGWMVQWMMGFKDGRRKTGVMGDRNDKGSSTVKYLHFPLTVHLKSQTFFC